MMPLFMVMWSRLLNYSKKEHLLTGVTGMDGVPSMRRVNSTMQKL